MVPAIAEPSDDPVIGLDLAGTVTSWNAAATRVFGWVADAMVGGPVARMVPPGRAAEAAGLLARAAAGAAVTPIETERVARDGRLVPVLLTVSPVLDAGDRVAGVSMVLRDRSDLQRLNAELRGREALLQTVLDTMPDGLVVIDAGGIIRLCNRAAERMFGAPAAAMVGQNVRMLMHDSDAAQHDGHLRRYGETGERRIIGIGRIVAARRADGSSFPAELQVGEVRAEGVRLFTGVLRDLTERQARDRRLVELQAELIHVSRLSELGQMVSTLAHEVGQPLTAVTNYLSGIRRLLPADSPPLLREALERVAEQAERARGIVQSLRELVRKEQTPRTAQDLVVLIHETSALVLTGLNRAVTLRVDAAADAQRCVIDRVQVQQVLLNLMRNAVEAMAGQAEQVLTVSTRRAGDRIMVRVADCGPGLPAEVRGRLFEPFVTTKRDGLGVGLSICRTIVEAHGGVLVAEETPGGGATFVFSLPVDVAG